MYVCLSCMLRVYEYAFCSIHLLLVYLLVHMSSNPRSIAGVPFDSVGRFWASLLLRTTCMHSCCNWIASCHGGGITNQKPKTKRILQFFGTKNRCVGSN